MSKLGGVDKGLQGISQRFGSSLGASLNSAFSSFFAAETLTSVASSFVDILKIGLIQMNAEVEQMSIQWSTMFQAKSLGSFTEGLNASSELIRMMRADARALPGEFKDLSAIFSRVLTPGLNQGMSLRELEAMSASAMALGVGSGMKADVVGRELADLIQGNMRKNMPILKVLPNFAMDTKAFNALSRQQRIERIQQALGQRGGPEAKAMQEMIAATRNSWTGLTTTVKDNAREVLQNMTHYLFDSIKDALMKVNQWYDDNHEKIIRWAKSVGGYLAAGFQVARDYFIALEPAIIRIGHALKRILDNGELSTDLMKLAGVAGALKVGGAIAPVAGGLAKYAPELLGAGGSALGGLGAALGLGEGIVATGGALAAVIVAVGAAMTAVYGIFEGLANYGSPFNEAMTEMWHDIQEAAVGTVKALGHAFNTAEPALRRVAEALGAMALAGLEGIADAILAIANAFDSFVTAVSDSWGNLKDVLKSKFPGMDWFFEPDAVTTRRRREFEDEHVSSRGLGLLDIHPPPPPPNHTTHIHNVEIKVTSNQDPSRVARETAEILLDWHRHPRVSRLNPNNQFAR